MSHRCKAYDPKCDGCRPVFIEPATGRKLEASDPINVAAQTAWDLAPLAERQAWYRVCSLNSRAPADLEATTRVTARMTAACEAITKAGVS